MDTEKTNTELLTQQFPLFETNLFIPRYKAGQWGDWQIKKAGFCLDHGYFTGTWLLKDLPVLSKKSNDDSTMPETWMSPSAYEIESQEIGCRNSFGHTVIGGLGLGWNAVNAALRSETTKVTVLEIDEKVISLINELNVFGQIEPEYKNKINICHTDALKWQPAEKVDFLFVDIWAKHAEATTLGHVRQMQQNINAKSIYFWGQEITIYTEAKKLYPDMEHITSEMVKQTIEKSIKLPLLVPENIDYAQLINNVIANRIKRNLPLIRE
jgi:isopentenyl phosphate kinase